MLHVLADFQTEPITALYKNPGIVEETLRTGTKQYFISYRDMVLFIEPARLPSRPIALVDLLLQEENVTRLMDEKHTADFVKLDFAKAFDSVYHRFLPAKP